VRRPLGRVPRLAAVAVLVAFALAPDLLLAQNANLGAQQLGRPYWHVFAAYAIGWVLIFGWVVSIARRLRSLERKIDTE
jgi:CcmD family protein